jgi:hypothetical protein
MESSVAPPPLSSKASWGRRATANSPRLTRRHLLYLLLVQGLLAGLLDAGINFGLHTAVYSSGGIALTGFSTPQGQPATPIAGDMAITLFVQLLLTWLIVGLLVWNDVRIGLIAPLEPTAFGAACLPAPPHLAGLSLQRATVWATDMDDVVGARYWRARLGQAAPRNGLTAAGSNVLRGLVWAVPAFCVLWPIGVGLTGGIFGTYDFQRFPLVPSIFAVYGGVLGLLTTPIAAACALVTAGRRLTAVPVSAA